MLAAVMLESRQCCKQQGITFEYKRCKAPDCNKHAAKKGYCINHAREVGIEVIRAGRLCAYEECGKPSHKKGLCRQHARQQGLYTVHNNTATTSADPAPTPTPSRNQNPPDMPSAAVAIVGASDPVEAVATQAVS